MPVYPSKCCQLSCTKSEALKQVWLLDGLNFVGCQSSPLAPASARYWQD